MIPALIVPILTRPELLHRMLDSIDHPIGDLAIIDNGNCFPAWEPVEHVERTHVIKMPANLGVAGSWNLGIKALPFAPYWLIANHDIVWNPGSLATFAQCARTDALVLSSGMPPWAAFAIGEDVVARVGLFDEAFHPGYFEDNDMEHRVRTHGIPVLTCPAAVDHDNSSTLRSGYEDRNTVTFTANAAYYQDKLAAGDLSAGHWSLARRRELSWD